MRLERGQEFLEVVRDDRSLAIRSGRVGTEGTIRQEACRDAQAAQRERPALERLVLDGSYLSDEMVAALRARFPRVSATEQRPPTTSQRRVVVFLHV